ncbi:MAG TPA: MFS transporter, partial [Vicinamibacteria bacterium]|nr:MFS transporter [Vicinamibacteria bacterium]
ALSWRAIFFINVPVAIAVIWIMIQKVPDPPKVAEPGPLDILGSALATLGLAGMVLGLIESSTHAWSDPGVVVSLVVGGAFLLGFVLAERRTAHPMVPPELFRSPTFRGANLLTLLLYGALSVMTFYLPFNLIQVQGYSPAKAGASFLPFIALITALSGPAGRLLPRLGPRFMLGTGAGIVSLGFVLLALPGKGGPYWTTFFPGIVVVGLGMSAVVAPLTTTVLGSVDDRATGIASGFNNAVARVGGLLAIALVGLVALSLFNRALDHHLVDLNPSPEVREKLDDERAKLGAARPPAGLSETERRQMEAAIAASFVTSFRGVMLLAAGLAVASAAVALRLPAARPRKAS